MDRKMASKIREQILKVLLENRETYISGQKLSEQLGCTRAAVWKQMEELRQAGYVFEAKARCGYKLIFIPDLVTADELRPLLRTQIFGQQIYSYLSVDSTQNVANDLANRGAPEGTVVLTEFQTAGKGRLGRKWSKDHSKGIAMSLILRPQVPLQKISELTLVIAVALVHAIQKTTGLHPKIKWPNDIFLDGKKLCGVLTELKGESDRLNYILVGIGINVNETIENLGDELSDIATSLLISGKQPVSRAKLVANILFELEQLYPIYLTEGFLPIKKIWEQYSLLNNQEIIARTANGFLEGVYGGITEEGILLLRDKSGMIQKIITGDVYMKEQ